MFEAALEVGPSELQMMLAYKAKEEDSGDQNVGS
jgi:hypothetical protein